MSPHQPPPVTPFTGSPFDLDGRDSSVSSSAMRPVDVYKPLPASPLNCAAADLVTAVA
jgi:hypothetical protein